MKTDAQKKKRLSLTQRLSFKNDDEEENENLSSELKKNDLNCLLWFKKNELKSIRFE